MKNIGKIIKGLFLILTTCIYIVSVKAQTTSIGETSDLKGINITKNVTNATSDVNVTFYYNVSEVRDENPEGIDGINESFSIVFDNVKPNFGHVAQAIEMLDLSSLTFSKVGDYYLKICEIGSSNETIYPHEDKCYYPLVMVRNELNNNTCIIKI